MLLPSVSRLLACLLLGSFTFGQETGTEAPPIEPVEQQGEGLNLSLPQALQLALRNSLGLRIAEVETERAGFDHLGSWGEYEWDFTATARYVDSEREVTSSFISGGATIESEDESLELDFRRPLQTGGTFNVNFNTNRQTTNSVIANAETLVDDALALSLVQPLRRGAWREYVTATQRQRELEWRTQLEVQRQTRQDIVNQVVSAYWDLVAAIEQAEVAGSALDLGRELLGKRQRELTAGVGTEVEVLESRAEVATRIEALLRAENTVAQTMDDLKLLLYGDADSQLLDLPLTPSTALPSVDDAPELPGVAEAILTATEMRSELRQQRLALDLARLQHQRTLSERLSGLDLSLTASSGAVDRTVGGAFSDTLDWDFPTYSIALTYNMPLGNKTADYAERSARAAVRQSGLDYDRTELDVVADVRRAVRDVKYRAEAVRAAETSLALAERQLEAEKARNEQGLSTNYQVLEIQQAYVEALSNERQARVEYAKALVALEAAQGLLADGGLEQ